MYFPLATQADDGTQQSHSWHGMTIGTLFALSSPGRLFSVSEKKIAAQGEMCRNCCLVYVTGNDRQWWVSEHIFPGGGLILLLRQQHFCMFPKKGGAVWEEVHQNQGDDSLVLPCRWVRSTELKLLPAQWYCTMCFCSNRQRRIRLSPRTHNAAARQRS